MKRAMVILLLLALASVSPLIFPLAESGRSSMDVLAKLVLLPAGALLLITVGALYRSDDSLARTSALGLAAGAIATVALEFVRLPGFWLGFMPGKLPRLMGVLLLNQFAAGPSLKSDIAGWAYHFWNGASFGLIYVLVFGTCRRWMGTVFGLSLGVGFIFSPVVAALGVGFMGLEFSKGFPLTVTIAHAAFGLALGWLATSWLGFVDSPLLGTVRQCLPNTRPPASCRTSRGERL
jgi:hypothetical protein